MRYANGNTPTKYTYTGQYSYTSDFGLMYYGARWYDPTLGRFNQPDTIIPSGPQGYDRFAYSNNNPLKYVDPDGHNPILFSLILLGAMVLSGDSPTPETIAENKAKVAAIAAVDKIAAANSDNSANALVEMFASDTLSRSTAQDRLQTVLYGTESGIGGQQFRGEFTDSGFAPQFQDGNDQVGHFLTAVGIGFISGDSPIGIGTMVGHEMFPDITGQGSGIWDNAGKIIQIGIGLGDSTARSAFMSGTDDGFQTVLDRGYSFQNSRYGNTIEDLRLSYMGWVLGKMIANGDFQNNSDVAQWIEDNIAD